MAAPPVTIMAEVGSGTISDPRVRTRPELNLKTTRYFQYTNLLSLRSCGWYDLLPLAGVVREMRMLLVNLAKGGTHIYGSGKLIVSNQRPVD